MKKGISEEIIRSAASGIAAVSGDGVALDEFLETLPDTVRRSVSHLLFCYYRYKKHVDSSLKAFLKTPPRPQVSALLHAAVAQLYFQSAIAPESAVNIAVEAAKRLHSAPLVNALLHRILENMPEKKPETPEDILPDVLLRAWKKRFQREELKEMTGAILAEPLFSFRTIRDFPPPESAQQLPGWGGFRFFAVDDPAEVLDSAIFREGGYYIQDPATSLAPSLPDYTQVSTALELCAAPGGKTLMIAERLRKGVKIIAADRSAKRQKLTVENCRLRGVDVNVITALPHEICGSFDLVVADVPCGNSGVFRRRPDAMWRYSINRQRELVALQKEILAPAAKLVSPGGQLVYSTCSIEPEEDILQMENFVREHPEFTILKSRLLLPSPVNDGAYAALLVKKR